MLFSSRKTQMIEPDRALPGRDEPMPVPARHEVLGTPLMPPFPEGLQRAVFGMGCFWGAERVFWQADGVYTTAAGYAGGFTPNPSYEEVCSAGTGHAEVVLAVFGMGCFWGAERVFWQADGVYTTAAGYAGGFTPNPSYEEVCSAGTGHAEVVLAVFDPNVTSYEAMLQLFWENHDPTQGMRQGNDVGTQYRSAIYVQDDAQRSAAEASKAMYQERLTAAGHGEITTEIVDAGPFYYAEDYHQQYLAKNPNGYCGLGGTGVSCPIGLHA